MSYKTEQRALKRKNYKWPTAVFEASNMTSHYKNAN